MNYNTAYLSLLPLLLDSLMIIGPYISQAGLPWPDTLNAQVYPLNAALVQLTLLYLQLFINKHSIISGVKSLLHRHANTDTMLLLGIIGSLGMALLSLDTIGKAEQYPLTLELFIFNGIALLTISAFSDCAFGHIHMEAISSTHDTLRHIAIWYVPVMLIIGLLVTGITAMYGEFNIAYFFLILLASCPAGIKLIYPMLLLKLSSLCDENGITIQKPEALELLPQIDVVACSLIGILTKGEPEVKDMISQGIIMDKMLLFGATAETCMDNSIAWAIVKEARRRKITLGTTTGSNPVPGHGIEVIYNHMLVRVGNAQLLKMQRIDINSEMTTKADQMAGKGMVALYVNSGHYCRGVIGVLDEIAPEASVAVTSLHDMSVETILLTGKDKTTARYFGRNLNLDQAIGNLKPEDKAKEIQVRKAQGQIVAAMSGSPSFKEALDTADISFVPMSAHPDIRKDAHILLENNDINAISQAVAMGLSWQTKVQHCIGVTFLLNILMLSFAFTLIWQGNIGYFHPLIPLVSTVITIVCLGICSNTLNAE